MQKLAYFLAYIFLPNIVIVFFGIIKFKTVGKKTEGKLRWVFDYSVVTDVLAFYYTYHKGWGRHYAV